MKPSIFATSIFFFINSWNEYFWPLLILADRSNYTLPLALQMFISAEGGSEWGIAMAVAMFTTLPPPDPVPAHPEIHLEHLHAEWHEGLKGSLPCLNPTV